MVVQGLSLLPTEESCSREEHHNTGTLMTLAVVSLETVITMLVCSTHLSGFDLSHVHVTAQQWLL